MREYLGLGGSLRGRSLDDVMEAHGLSAVRSAAERIAADDSVSYEDVELSMGGQPHRFRIVCHNLKNDSDVVFGQVVLAREVSHENLRSRYDDLVGHIVEVDGELRQELETALDQLRGLAEDVRNSHVDSPGMVQLGERLSRTLTAIENWLDVDEALAVEEFPDAQLLLDRIRVATARWPLVNRIPARVRELAKQVDQYYESGENPKQRVL
jgi:hypothetical protein